MGGKVPTGQHYDDEQQWEFTTDQSHLASSSENHAHSYARQWLGAGGKFWNAILKPNKETREQVQIKAESNHTEAYFLNSHKKTLLGQIIGSSS